MSKVPQSLDSQVHTSCPSPSIKQALRSALCNQGHSDQLSCTSMRKKFPAINEQDLELQIYFPLSLIWEISSLEIPY